MNIHKGFFSVKKTQKFLLILVDQFVNVANDWKSWGVRSSSPAELLTRKAWSMLRTCSLSFFCLYVIRIIGFYRLQRHLTNVGRNKANIYLYYRREFGGNEKWKTNILEFRWINHRNIGSWWKLREKKFDIPISRNMIYPVTRSSQFRRSFVFFTFCWLINSNKYRPFQIIFHIGGEGRTQTFRVWHLENSVYWSIIFGSITPCLPDLNHFEHFNRVI